MGTPIPILHPIKLVIGPFKTNTNLDRPIATSTAIRWSVSEAERHSRVQMEATYSTLAADYAISSHLTSRRLCQTGSSSSYVHTQHEQRY